MSNYVCPSCGQAYTSLVPATWCAMDIDLDGNHTTYHFTHADLAMTFFPFVKTIVTRIRRAA